MRHADYPERPSNRSLTFAALQTKRLVPSRDRYKGVSHGPQFHRCPPRILVMAAPGGTGHRLSWPVTARAVPPAALGCGYVAGWGRRFRLPSSSRVFDRAVFDRAVAGAIMRVINSDADH